MEIREPKFKRGDKVRNLEDGHAYTVESIYDYKFMQDEYWYNLYEYWYNLSGHLCVIPESALELYIDKPKTIWDVKEGDECFFITAIGNVFSRKWDGSYCALRNMEIGNVFLAKEEALVDLERRKVEVEMLCLGGRRTFKKGENNWFIYYNDGLNVTVFNDSISQGAIYFDSEDEAHNAIKTIGEDRIKKYIFGVES